VSVAEGRALVRDLGSRNGTLLDGVAVVAAHPRSGSTLTLGRTEIRFELRGDAVRVPVSTRARFGRLVGASVPMRRAFALLERAAGGDAPVLLEGEAGTGKDLAAEAVHAESARRDGPFVLVDCASIPEASAERELFGEEGGRAGAFEAAARGTVFLDGVDALGAEMQARLLRALERRQVKRAGGAAFVPVDARVLAATRSNLRREVNDRRFRGDLYQRLAVIEVRLPPLRERVEDLPGLVADLLADHGAPAPALTQPEFLAALARHEWPGNVRELEAHLERCLAHREELPVDPAGRDEAPLPDTTKPLKAARELWTRALERRYVEALLGRNGDNVAAAARDAGVDRMHFYRLLWRYGLR
jgi:DNA-binding NtrC family response regulator